MKSIELFAGIGGLGIGVQKAGFDHVLAIEKNRECCKTIESNIGVGLRENIDLSILNADIRDISFKEYEGSIDLLSGGPPCQPFSLAGKHKAEVDARDMFPEAIRAVREIKPRAFIFENVKGLTRYSFSNYLEYIRLHLTFPNIAIKGSETWNEHFSRLEAYYSNSNFRGLSYKVLIKVLNSADYGVAQKRERVFFVGFRSDICANWCFPAPTHSKNSLVWSKLFGNYWDLHKVPKKQRFLNEFERKLAETMEDKPQLLPWNTLRSSIMDLPDPVNHRRLSENYNNHVFRDGARMYKGHTGSVLDEPSKTLKAGAHGVPGGENMIRKFDHTVRYLTIRESARLQGFPDDFKFNCSWGESMRQIGNAVPVELARIISESIYAHIR